jgi:hypothetical protein
MVSRIGACGLSATLGDGNCHKVILGNHLDHRSGIGLLLDRRNAGNRYNAAPLGLGAIFP